MKQLLAATALALTLAACSKAPETAPDSAATTAAPITSEDGTAVGAGTATETATASPTAAPTAAAKTLALEGLGDLKLGQPVPAGSKWAERGAQASDACRTVSSSDYPGVYAIVEGGKVRRVTAGQRSTVKLAEGIGVGATEAEVKKWFAGFRSTPHKYEAAPAKYLTAPGGSATDPALRFEIGQDGKVSQIHVGLMPQLEYVEGCA